MTQRIKRTLTYISKIVIGIFLSHFMALFVPDLDFGWILISAFLVLSPDGKDAVEVALIRIKANLIGAGTGLMILVFDLPMLWGMCIGAAVALILCELLNLSLGAKSTLASVVIVLMENDPNSFWNSPLHRIGSVIAGCILALIITYVYHKLLKLKPPVMSNEASKEIENIKFN